MSERSYSYSRQEINNDDIRSVTRVLRSDWLTQGPSVERFERDLSSKLRAKHVSVVSSGTAALHLLGLALGWRPGDLVITSPLTFLASANCILYAGATPDFVDIDPHSYTIDIGRLRDRIEEKKKQGKRVKAVVAVDYAGHPCDWKSLRELADRHGFQLVDDACHALGAKLGGDIGYAARFADAAVLSFHPVKHITTGEGGAVLTNDSRLDETLKILRTHGVTKNRAIMEKSDGPWYYEMHDLGFNYRITDLQCALGSSQLKRLDRIVSQRRRVAEYYDRVLSSADVLVTPGVSQEVEHSYHLYPLLVKFESLKVDRKELFERLSKKRINCQVHYIPVHLQPYYRKNYGFKEGDFPEAESFYRREISIPMYPSLGKDDLKYITTSLLESLEVQAFHQKGGKR